MELRGRIAGRTATPFFAEVIRDLTEEDLLLRRATPVGSEARPLVKLRYQHHRLAQLISSGSGEAEASLITGYSLSRISILKADPAFRELLAQYSKTNKEVFADLQTRMAGFSLDALDELQDRLEVQPESYTNKELIEAVKVTNDRGGNSPISRSQVSVAVLSAEDLIAMKKEVRDLESGRITKISQVIENNSEPQVGKIELLTTSEDSEEPAIEGLSG